MKETLSNQLDFFKKFGNSHIIYGIQSPSNKVYIGQTKNLFKRMKSYFGLYCKGQRKLYHSFLKYGIENHKIDILAMTNKPNRSFLNHSEIIFMEIASENGFELLNLRGGGENGIISEETKQIISKKATERGDWSGSNNPRSKDKLFGNRNGMYGRNHSQYSKEKIVLTKIEKYGDALLKSAINRESKRKQSIADWKVKVSANRLGKGKIKPRKVVQLSENREYIAEYDSMNKAGIALGIVAQHISKSVRNNKFAPTTRFYFMYAEGWELFKQGVKKNIYVKR